MTLLSIFMLGLYVFLQASQYMKWFEVDPKLLGIVGIAFVVILIVEQLLGLAGRLPKVLRRGE